MKKSAGPRRRVIGDPVRLDSRPKSSRSRECPRRKDEVQSLSSAAEQGRGEDPAREKAPGWREQYRQLPDACRSSRAPHPDGLPAVLGKAGMAGKAAPQTGADRLPDGVEERLGMMAFAEQFDAPAVARRHSGSTGRRPAGSRRCCAAMPISGC